MLRAGAPGARLLILCAFVMFVVHGSTAASSEKQDDPARASSPASTPSALAIDLATPSGPDQTAVEPMTEKNVEAFLDPLVAKAMAEWHVPGVAVIVVKDGAVLLSKGYGYADLDRQIRVDADRTLFRAGSVSKLVTATAVMQLVEKGRIDLRADVNRLLPRPIVPQAFGAPVTCAELLTHTGGFEERLVRTAASSRAEVLPLLDYLSRDLPRRVLPPGQTLLYSNHGYTLLGAVVESASGRPFEAYVQESIFGPLGMRRSAMALPNPWDSDLATGYEIRGGRARSVPPAYLQIGPAAGLVTTASDMGRFMLALLSLGTLGEVRILGEEAARTMQAEQFTHHPGLPGMTYGFYESAYFNRRFLYHLGGIRGFASLLCLLPAERLGVFVVNNGYQTDFGWQVVDPIAKKWFPGDARTPPPPGVPNAADRGLAGQYRHVKYARTTLEKLGQLRGYPIDVKPRNDGALAIGGITFIPIGGGLYKEAGGFEQAAFRLGTDGFATYLFLGQEAFERLSWFELPGFHQLLVLLFLGVFGSALFLSTDRVGAGRLAELLDSGVALAAPTPAPVRRAHLFAAVVAAFNLLFLLGLAIAMWLMRPGSLWLGWPLAIRGLLAVPLFSCPLALALPFFVPVVLREPCLPRGRRAHYLLVVTAAVGFIPFLVYWNLLGAGL